MTENTLTMADSTTSHIDSSTKARPGHTPSEPGWRTETPQRGRRLRVATCLALAIVVAACGSDDTAVETMTAGAVGGVTAAEEVPCPDGLRTIAEVLGTKDLQCADLKGANLTGAILNNVNLNGADLTDANLTGAMLSDADLTGAILTDANLTGANLRGANLRGANLTGANLTGVLWLITTCPDGANIDNDSGFCG